MNDLSKSFGRSSAKSRKSSLLSFNGFSGGARLIVGSVCRDSGLGLVKSSKIGEGLTGAFVTIYLISEITSIVGFTNLDSMLSSIGFCFTGGL